MAVVSKTNAEHYVWGDACDGWHLVQAEGLSVIHERMPPDTSEVRHAHEVSRQFFFVLSGKLTLEVDGERHELAAHSGLEIPPGAAHQALNVHEEPVEFVVISHPPAQGDRVPA